MALVGTLVLYGAVFAAAYASFLVGRLLAGWLFRVGERVPPFGEARPSGFDRARPGARVAVTLGGPVGVYAFGAIVYGFGLWLAGTSVPSTILNSVVPGSAADSAGLRENDRITAIAGKPVSQPEQVRPALIGAPDDRVEVTVERDGRPLHVEATLDTSRRLGVQFASAREAVSLGRAFHLGAVAPYHFVSDAVSAVIEQPQTSTMGPVGIVTIAAKRERFGDRLVIAGITISALLFFVSLGSLLMWPPRPSPEPAGTSGGAERQIPADAKLVARPWVRMLARAFDLMLIWVALGLASQLLTAFAALLWIPIEALLLARWGFTPGNYEVHHRPVSKWRVIAMVAVLLTIFAVILLAPENAAITG